jgi:hypothetical protein
LELVPVAAAPPPEPDIADDTRASQQRKDLTSDTVSPENQTESPYDAGHREFQQMIADGRPKDESAARFVHTVLEAASGANPDPRVISDR